VRMKMSVLFVVARWRMGIEESYTASCFNFLTHQSRAF
jgi:hypothetical protein